VTIHAYNDLKLLRDNAASMYRHTDCAPMDQVELYYETARKTLPRGGSERRGARRGPVVRDEANDGIHPRGGGDGGGPMMPQP